jgi:hypothetical protein
MNVEFVEPRRFIRVMHVDRPNLDSCSVARGEHSHEGQGARIVWQHHTFAEQRFCFVNAQILRNERSDASCKDNTPAQGVRLSPA